MDLSKSFVVLSLWIATTANAFTDVPGVVEWAKSAGCRMPCDQFDYVIVKKKKIKGGKVSYEATGNSVSPYGLIIAKKGQRELQPGACYQPRPFLMKYVKSEKMEVSTGFDVIVDVWEMCEN